MKHRSVPAIIGTVLVSLALLAWVFYPLGWVLVSSIKPPSEVFSGAWFGFRPTLENYAQILRGGEFLKSFINSLIVTCCSIVLALAVGTPAAYGLSRFRYRLGTATMIFVLMARMTPPVVLAVPFFLIARWLGVSNTYLALVVMGTFLAVPFVIWMMRGFIAEIPAEIEESAIVEGCSRGEAALRIVLPLVAPGLAATAVLCALLVWNEFLFVLILSGPQTRTLPVLVNSYVSERSIPWGAMSAAGVVTVAPLILFGLLSQKHLVRGLTMGSIK